MTFLWIGLALVGFVLLLCFLVAPGPMSPQVKKAAQVFYGCNCAHRGLHTQDQTVPENSLAAFAAAREAGYGVELDVQLSKDGQVVVFHDDDLSRACGVPGRVDALDWKGLQALALFGGQQRIPLFAEVLQALGDTPVIVELKSAGKSNALLCEKTLALLREGGQNWCVESFDPRVVAWFRQHAPEVLRGQLSNPPKDYENLRKPLGFLLGNLLTNVAARPHFVAYDTSKRPFLVKLCYALGAMRVVWTVHASDAPELRQRENDAVIFEYYRPAPRYAGRKNGWK